MYVRSEDAIQFVPRALELARKRARLSPLKAAKRAGVTEQMIPKYEAGANSPSLETFFRLLGGYGMSLADFHQLVAEVSADVRLEALESRIRKRTKAD